MSSMISRCSIGLAALLVSCALDPKTIGSETETAISGSAEGSGGSTTGDSATGGTSAAGTSQGTGGGSGDTRTTDGAATEGGATTSVIPMTCEELIAAFQAEGEAIRSCDTTSDCGQVLQGTSCGCTREWVARLDADTTMFFALLEALGEQECDFGIDGVCDCPEADGFACLGDPEGAERMCGWNYL